MVDNRFGGGWSADKLDRVQSYIKAYLTAMSDQRHWRYVYIDAYAGSGYQIAKPKSAPGNSFAGLFDEEPRSDIDEAANYIVGSAMRAIHESENQASSGHASFAQFIFVDINRDALETLRSHIERESPAALAKCSFIEGDANIEIPKILACFDWAYTRGVAFIDPYNLSISKTTLEAIATTEGLDVWFLFPLMATLRVMAKTGVPDSWRKKLNTMYGDQSWESAIYEERQVYTLFDDEPVIQTERNPGVQDVLSYTTEWLKSIFADASDNPYIIKTDRGTLMFALYSAIASHNEAAIKLWKRISGHILKQAPHRRG